MENSSIGAVSNSANSIAQNPPAATSKTESAAVVAQNATIQPSKTESAAVVAFNQNPPLPAGQRELAIA